MRSVCVYDILVYQKLAASEEFVGRASVQFQRG